VSFRLIPCRVAPQQSPTPLQAASQKYYFIEHRSRLTKNKQPTFCPLMNIVSKTAYFLSITPKISYFHN